MWRTEGRLAWWALSAAIVVSFGGCSTPEADGSHDGGLSSEAAQQQYDERTAALKLPDGASWPGLPETAPDGGSISYSRWAPTVRVESHWRCAWQGEWLDSVDGDEKRADTALNQLKSFTTMRTYQSQYDQPSRDQFDDQLRKAKLGDPEPTQADQEINCEAE